MPMYEVRTPNEVGPNAWGFMVVEGRARRVGQGRGNLYIDFNDDWRDTVSIDIAMTL